MRKDRTGFTTGTCAAAASKAATLLLCGLPAPDEVEVALPDGVRVALPVESAGYPEFVEAAVRRSLATTGRYDGCVVSARAE
jgi:cobalt-precorrin-5B (C1)-methyltransferase